MEERVRRLRTYLLGWRGYFGFCETGSVLRDLDSWIRHRLRCVQWKQWKVYGRSKAELIRLGGNPGTGPHNGSECERSLAYQSYARGSDGAQQRLF